MQSLGFHQKYFKLKRVEHLLRFSVYRPLSIIKFISKYRLKEKKLSSTLTIPLARLNSYRKRTRKHALPGSALMSRSIHTRIVTRNVIISCFFFFFDTDLIAIRTTVSRPNVIIITVHRRNIIVIALACTVDTPHVSLGSDRYIRVFYTHVSSSNYCLRAIVFHRLIFPVPDNKLKSLPYLSIYVSISLSLSISLTLLLSLA